MVSINLVNTFSILLVRAALQGGLQALTKDFPLLLSELAPPHKLAGKLEALLSFIDKALFQLRPASSFCQPVMGVNDNENDNVNGSNNYNCN